MDAARWLDTLNRLFIYSADTGLITRRIRAAGQAAGTVAGSITRCNHRKIRVLDHYFAAHRVAWLMHYGEWPSGSIDHIDGNPQNNAIANLRLATHTDNMRNRGLSKRNKSGCLGVRWCEKQGVWIVTIGGIGKSNYLGRFKCLLDAAACRKSAEAKLDYHPNHGKRETTPERWTARRIRIAREKRA